MMSYNFEKLFQDHNIDYDPINSRGYTHVRCPFCRDDKLHGGFHSDGFFSCFKCGTHSTYDTIMILIGENWFKIKDVYETDSIVNPRQELSMANKISLPTSLCSLHPEAEDYLVSRGFNPEHLKKTYDLKCASWGEWRWRIIIPIYYGHEIVSYIGRDYTNKSPLRYKACAVEDEVIHHKHILYNLDRSIGDHAVIVEGVTDVWKLGGGSIATFGTGYTPKQVNLLAQKYKQVTLLYDADPEAQIRSQKIGEVLAGVGLKVNIIFLESGDPGSLPQEEADKLMKDILE